jgi:hypothetical protein
MSINLKPEHERIIKLKSKAATSGAPMKYSLAPWLHCKRKSAEAGPQHPARTWQSSSWNRRS